MKKLLLILVLACVSVMLTAQTNFSPRILHQEMYYTNGDTLHTAVYQNMENWDNKQMKIHLVRKEWKNSDSLSPRQTSEYTFHQLMDSTYTHERDNGNLITQSGRWFVEAVFESGSIDWPLWQELGRSIYFYYWDTNQEYLIKP